MKRTKTIREKEMTEAIIKKYPELDDIAERISVAVLMALNYEVKDVKSEMPYKAQYVLEMIIQKLEAHV
jgi:hypothetical protein